MGQITYIDTNALKDASTSKQPYKIYSESQEKLYITWYMVQNFYCFFLNF